MIRKAKADDSERITRIHINTWKTTYKDFFPEEVFINQDKNFQQRNINIKQAIEQDDEFHYLVYEENEKILGFACYGKGRGEEFLNDGEVYSLYIEKENQKKGIGKKLVKECFNMLKNMGYKIVIIRCLQGNPSENFYSVLGGIVIAEEKGQVGNTNIVENVFVFKI